jgi:hypothetical protein
VKTNKKQKEWGHGSRLQWKALGKHEALNSIFNTAHHTQKKSNLKKSLCWALTPVILADQEDCGPKPAWANSSQDPISKNSITKSWAGECSSPSTKNK